MIFCTVILIVASPYALAADANAAAIQAIREYALSYSKTLPNFLCTLTTQHVSRPPNAVNNPNIQSAVIVEQLSLLNNKEIRKTVKVEGADPDSVRGPLSQGEFGTLLLTIFDPARGTHLTWSRVATLDGHKVDVLSYHVPQSSGYVLTQSTGELQVPFEGSVYADRQTHAVLRIQAKCTGIPPTAEYRFVELTLDYGPAKVAGREYILPSRFVLDYMNSRQDRQNLNSGRFSAYREFSADTSIHFDGDKQ
jgi:hypothetical protein